MSREGAARFWGAPQGSGSGTVASETGGQRTRERGVFGKSGGVRRLTGFLPLKAIPGRIKPTSHPNLRRLGIGRARGSATRLRERPGRQRSPTSAGRRPGAQSRRSGRGRLHEDRGGSSGTRADRSGASPCRPTTSRVPAGPRRRPSPALSRQAWRGLLCRRGVPWLTPARQPGC